MMRIPIREQLALLILLSALIGLAVISIATWISNHQFVLSICSSRLSLTASLKAAQLASNLDLMQTTATFLTTRVIIQGALERYNWFGNNTESNWIAAKSDMSAAVGNGGSVGQALLLQAMVLPKNGTGPGGPYGLLNTTSQTIIGQIHLPYICPNGKPATLGMNASACGGYNYGYPPDLYPNLTYFHAESNTPSVEQTAVYKDATIGPNHQSALMLGPWKINDTFSLVSITLPMLNNTNRVDVLGYLTAVMDARLINQVLDSTEGLENTGETLLVGPVKNTNLFPPGILYDSNHGDPSSDFQVHYVVPLNKSYASRHPNKTIGAKNAPWPVYEYPAVQSAITVSTGQKDNSGAMVKGYNEAGQKVASGYATPQTNLVNWVVIVEQSRGEVWAPINRLRDILLACVFATFGLMAIIAFPLAHFASLPIRRLREATAKSIEPPGLSASRSSIGSFDSIAERHADGAEDVEAADGAALARKEGMKNAVSNWRQRRHQDRDIRRDRRRKREFRIPGKVKERKHIVKDELSDLTSTFNEMSDELMMQYTKLEERVQQRTAELEQSKKAAEAANESKTLFIANISHELKTPLNGILGMCAVCMQEDDPLRLKRSLGIIYKSGDLLLNLLTDLLTFSKNQVGQHLSLDEKEFRLRDVSSQILAIFDKQATDGQIDLRVEWEGVQNIPQDNSSPERTDFGPNGTGRLKDMILWGDLQRILQVVINLVSNSLKFTPSGGSVVLTIRCLPDVWETASRKGSSASKQSKQSRPSRHTSSRTKGGSDSMLPGGRIETANAINAKDKPHALSHVYAQERAASPPPGVFLSFEFEVLDSGPGIPEELQSKIFEPFVQGDLGLSKKFGGTGLGLSICSQLASLMRGTVNVRSTVGVGSTFTMTIPLRHLKTRADSSASSSVELPIDGGIVPRGVTLDDEDWTPARHSRHLASENDEKASLNTGPASTPTLGSDSQPRLVGLSQPFFAASTPLESPGSQPAAMEKIAADATRIGGKIRVLVAEDNKVNQEVVLRMLKLEDIYDVTVAKDGQEALDFVKATMDPSEGGEERKPYNLIFMDVQMPNVDGLQSTRLIREIGYQAPIVALTAFAEESNIKDCLDSGMNYFLAKPIRRPQLKKVLKEYCAPIPEENEDPTPPELNTERGQNTTVVLVNGSETNEPQVRQSSELRIDNAESARTAEERGRPSSPLSPMTKEWREGG